MESKPTSLSNASLSPSLAISGGEKPAFDRRPVSALNGGGGGGNFGAGGEQRFNRRNNNDANGNAAGGNDSRPARRFNNNNAAASAGGDSRPAYGDRKPGGAQRFDRKSGSERSGVKAVDKREGGGAHNWGTHKQDIEDLRQNGGGANAGGAAESQSDASDKEGGGEPKTAAAAASAVAPASPDAAAAASGEAADATTTPKPETPEQIAAAEAARLAEEEARELTLDEWKAQRGVRAKPQFNIRKAGEGEDTSQWKQMVALQSRKKVGVSTVLVCCCCPG